MRMYLWYAMHADVGDDLNQLDGRPNENHPRFPAQMACRPPRYPQVGSVLRSQLTDIQREAFEGLNAYFAPEKSANFILSKIDNGNLPNSEALRTYVSRLLDLVLDKGNELEADTRVRLLNTVSGYYRAFPDLARFRELKSA